MWRKSRVVIEFCRQMHHPCGRANLPSLSLTQSIYNTTTTILLNSSWLLVWMVKRTLMLASLLMWLNNNACKGKKLLAFVNVWYRWWPAGRWPLIIFVSLPCPIPLLCYISVINVFFVSHISDDVSRPEQLLSISVRDLKTCSERLIKMLRQITNIITVKTRWQQKLRPWGSESYRWLLKSSGVWWMHN